MRAIGANAVMAGAFETDYGDPPVGGYYKLPLVSFGLGEEQPLIASDLLGYGRVRLDPSDDAADNRGDVVVPVDLRAFGFWLKGAFGDPVTTAVAAAVGTWTFTAQPANNATITVNGTVFTFVASGATGNQINKGATLSDTLDAATIALNASGVSAVAQATYSNSATVLTATLDTLGASGNAFTLARSASPASNATVSGATASGGSNKHTFVSGATELPSMSIEKGLTDVDEYSMNFGAQVNMLKIGLSRRGLLNSTVSVIAQGEDDPAGATAAGTPTEFVVERFAQAAGEVTIDGVVSGSVVSAEWSFSNDLDPVEVIRRDGRIGGSDPGIPMSAAQITVRYDTEDLVPDPGTFVEVKFGWEISSTKKLLITQHRVRFPKTKKPVSGPKGIQSTFTAEASDDLDLGKMVTVELTNDVASYA